MQAKRPVTRSPSCGRLRWLKAKPLAASVSARGRRRPPLLRGVHRRGISRGGLCRCALAEQPTNGVALGIAVDGLSTCMASRSTPIIASAFLTGLRPCGLLVLVVTDRAGASDAHHDPCLADYGEVGAATRARAMAGRAGLRDHRRRFRGGASQHGGISSAAASAAAADEWPCSCPDAFEMAARDRPAWPFRLKMAAIALQLRAQPAHGGGHDPSSSSSDRQALRVLATQSSSGDDRLPPARPRRPRQRARHVTRAPNGRSPGGTAGRRRRPPPVAPGAK